MHGSIAEVGAFAAKQLSLQLEGMGTPTLYRLYPIHPHTLNPEPQNISTPFSDGVPTLVHLCRIS